MDHRASNRSEDDRNGPSSRPETEQGEEPDADHSIDIEDIDFEEFGPSTMAEMSREEWETAFDPETWITGPELIDRVERDLKGRIGARDVFAELRRLTGDRLLAYSDDGYAILYPDGSVEGQGSIADDVKSSVVLCAMDDYEVPTVPDEWMLPHPDEVAGQTGELGNRMLQVIAGGMALGGLIMLGGSLIGLAGRAAIVLVFIGIAFILGGLFLLVIVANARLSARFRVSEYRDRLRAVGIDSGDVPSFVPVDSEEILSPTYGENDTDVDTSTE